jgi:hypothetical protein
MRQLHCRELTAVVCLILAGCVAQPTAVNPAETVALLRTGQPLLSCRDACVGEWQRAQPQAEQLAAAGRWAELAALTVRIGYQDDLSLYYLGLAAEGLGYPGAAASYYRQSTALSGTSIACRNLSRTCGGLGFPRAALLRLAVIDRNLMRPRPRRPVPATPTPGEPEAAPSEVEPLVPGEVVLPAPSEPAPPPAALLPPPPPPVTPSPPPVAPPRPPVAPAPFGATDYIEPPPAIR